MKYIALWLVNSPAPKKKTQGSNQPHELSGVKSHLQNAKHSQNYEWKDWDKKVNLIFN